MQCVRFRSLSVLVSSAELDGADASGTCSFLPSLYQELACHSPQAETSNMSQVLPYARITGPPTSDHSARPARSDTARKMSIRVTHPGSLRGRQSPSSVTNSPSSSGRHDSRKLSFKPIRGNPARFNIISQSFREVLEPLYGPQKSALDKVAAGHDRRCRLAVEPDGQPCGVLVYKTGISNEMAKYGIKDSIEIKTLYLINAAVNSGKGYAGEMLSYIVKKASDMRAASVHVTVSEKVPQSLTFFTKKGFRLVKTFTGLYQTGVKEYLLHLPLVADPASAAAGTPAAEPPAVDVATATGQQLQQPEQQLSYAASSRLSKSDYERLLPPSKCASTPLAVSDKSTANATAAITAITEGSKKRQFEELDDLYDRIGPTKTGNGQSSKAPHYAVMSDSKQGTKTQLESSSRLFPGPPQLHKGDGRSVPVAGMLA